MRVRNNFFRSAIAGIALLLLLPITLRAQDYNYAEVLQKSMFFYECQESALGPNNRVNWRGDAAMDDGSDVGHDLTGGWFDAGDHVKFNFPMAFSATALAWGGIDFADGYIASGQMQYLKRNLRYVNDYFIKCHTAPNELWGQVGNGGLDHGWWGSAEVMKMDRPAYKIDASNPGSDLAAETAAAMAAASILFQSDDPAYAAELIQHAEQLYSFADNYRGVYSESITDAAGYYRSYSGYNDELVWGAIWLYRATGDQSYLDKAEAYYADLSTEPQTDIKSYKWGIAWDDKSYGCYALLANITGKAIYQEAIERHLDFWTTGYNGEQITYTPGGLAYLDTWGALRYANNTGFLALYYHDMASSAQKSNTYLDFAISQADYALGDNPRNSSYVVGFGNNPTQNPHHRTAHGAWANNQNGPPDQTRHVLYGALAGGPNNDDSYEDDRSNYINNEVACDYNACFSGVMAGLVEEFGGSALANFPIPEEPGEEYFTGAIANSEQARFFEWSVQVFNHTAWPSREGDEYKFRLFVDISEGLDAGLTLDDYIVNTNNADVASMTDLIAWDEAANIYYSEVTINPGIEIWPGGDQFDSREAQIRIGIPNDAPEAGWDVTNDPSYDIAMSNSNDRSNPPKSYGIPLYVDGVLVFGEEPEGGNTIPAESVSVTPTTATLEIGEIQQLNAVVLPEDATNKNVTWESSNTSVATVSASGLVTAVSPGDAVITVETRSGGHTATANITVNEPPYIEVTDVTLNQTSLELDVNESFDLDATVLPTDATDQSVTWSSSDAGIASVSSTGLVTGTGEGTAVITVQTSNPAVSASCTVVVSDVIIEPTYFTLTVNTSGAGTVTLSPTSVDGTYEEGTQVTLTASPAADYQFDNWSGDVSGSSTSVSLVMDTDKAVTANFSLIPVGGDCSNPIAISLPFAQDGAGEFCFFTDGDINFINSWNTDVVEVNGVDITNGYLGNMPARQDGGYYIYYSASVAWAHMEIDGTDDGTEPTYYSLTTSVVGEGSVSPTDGTFEEGENVSLTATPAEGYEFAGWSGDASGTSTTISITMDSDKSVIATFTEENTEPTYYELTVSTVGQGSVTPDGGTYAEGTVVSLTATPATGYIFQGWTGDATGSSATTDITMDADKSVTATFVEDITGPADCDNPVSISIPFVQNGSGEYCWVTSTEIAYINSWGLEELTINGVDFTNVWSNSLPAANADGEWVIHYVGTYGWSHFEAPAAKAAESITQNNYFAYPNPFNTSINLDLSDAENLETIRVINQQGQLIEVIDATSVHVSSLELGADYQSGVYFIQVATSVELQTLRIVKE